MMGKRIFWIFRYAISLIILGALSLVWGVYEMLLRFPWWILTGKDLVFFETQIKNMVHYINENFTEVN